MATVADLIDQASRCTGIDAAKLKQLARVMREHGYLPESLPGGGRGAAHLDAGHLASFAIAAAVADPIAKVATILPDYAEMMHWSADDEAVALFPRTLRWLVTLDFQEALAALIDELSTRTIGEIDGLAVEIGTTALPGAFADVRLFGPSIDGGDPAHGRLGMFSNRPDQARYAAERKATPGRFQITTGIPPAFFDMLAELATDTRAKIGSSYTDRVSGNGAVPTQ